MALFCVRDEVTYFDSFGVEHILKEIKEFIGNKNIKANIYRLQANDSVMCGYFYIGFIDFMLAGKTLTDYTALFSPYDFNKNDQIILSYFKDAWNRCNKIIRSNKAQIVRNKKIENYFINEINKR